MSKTIPAWARALLLADRAVHSTVRLAALGPLDWSRLSGAELCDGAPATSPGFIFESAIADVYGTIRRRGIHLAGPLPEADLAVFDPLRKYARCAARALVLHGERDAIIPAREAEQTYASLQSAEKTLAYVPDRGHNDLSQGFVYWEEMDCFLAPRRG